MMLPRAWSAVVLALVCGVLASAAMAGRNEPTGDIRASGGGGTGGGSATVTYPLAGSADSAAAPDFAWTASPSTGLFSPGANLCAASANGAEIMRWGSSGAQLATGKQLLCAAGSAASPCLTFSANADRGFFNDTTNSAVGIAVGGAQTGYLGAAGLSLTAGKLLVPAGTAAAPTQAFTTATTTGNFYDAANTALGVAVGGTEVAYASAAGLRVLSGNTQNPNGTAAAPAYSFGGSAGTGVFVDSAVNALAASVNGTEAAYISANGELALPLSNMTFPGNVSGLRMGNLDATGIKIFRNGSGRVQFGLADGSANATAATRLWQTTNVDGSTQFSSAVSSDISGMKLYFDTTATAANMYAVLVQQRMLTQQKTAAYTVQKADTAKRFSNIGAASQTVYTLPPAAGINSFTAGTGAEVPFYVFVNTVAAGLQLKAQGSDVIQFPGAASSAGGTQTTTTVGASVKLFVCDAAKWCVEGAAGGTWTGA